MSNTTHLIIQGQTDGIYSIPLLKHFSKQVSLIWNFGKDNSWWKKADDEEEADGVNDF